MIDWFLMVALATRVVMVGPFKTEDECHRVQRTIFEGKTTVCVERNNEWLSLKYRN